MKLVGMNIVPARNLGNARLSSKALLNKPQLLSRSPSPPSLRTGKNRNRRHVCPLTCKLMGKHSHAPRHPGRWCSPDAYLITGLIGFGLFGALVSTFVRVPTGQAT